MQAKKYFLPSVLMVVGLANNYCSQSPESAKNAIKMAYTFRIASNDPKRPAFQQCYITDETLTFAKSLPLSDGFECTAHGQRNSTVEIIWRSGDFGHEVIDKIYSNKGQGK